MRAAHGWQHNPTGEWAWPSLSRYPLDMDRRLAPLVSILAGLSLLAYLVVIPGRLTFPFALEWQEGGMLAHVLRIGSEAPLYAAPNLEFSAFPYPPVFYWAASCVSLVTGVNFIALRLVSVIASLAILWMLACGARREGGSWLPGLVAAGLFAAAFSWSGAWMDVGRVDSLALALTLGSLLMVQRGGGTRDAVAAGVLAGLAVLTKQTALLPAGALALTLCLQGWRRWKAFALGLLVVGGGGLVGLHVSSQGWSSWYLFELLGSHPWHSPKILGFWTEDMIWFAPLVLALLWARRSSVQDGGASLAWCAGLLASAWIGRAHIGGFDNTLMPAALALAYLGGQMVGMVREKGGPGVAWVLGAVGLQFALLLEDPRKHLPQPGAAAQMEAVVQALEAVDGPIFAPYQPHLAARAGAGWSTHAMTFFDVSAADLGKVGEDLFVELRAALKEGRYSGVLLGEDDYFGGLLGLQYRRATADEFPTAIPLTLTGSEFGPRLLYLR